MTIGNTGWIHETKTTQSARQSQQVSYHDLGAGLPHRAAVGISSEDVLILGVGEGCFADLVR